MDTQFWAADDPKTAHAWATQFLDRLSPNSDLSQQISAMNLALGAAVQLENMEWIKAHEQRIREFMGHARTLNMIDHYLTLGQSLAEYLANSGQHAEAVKLYEQVIQDARNLNHPAMLMFSLTYFGQYYRSIGRTPEAMLLMREAYNLANNSQLNIHPYFREATLLTVIMTLQGEGFVKDGDAVMEKAFAYFEENHLRSATSVLAYNLATAYSLGKTADFAKAVYYSQKARVLAQSLGDVMTEAAALTKLATISNKQQHFTEAADFANQVIALVQGQETMWEALAQRENAEAFFYLGQPKKAFAAIERAISLLPANFQESQADMFEVKSLIEEKLGNSQSALTSYKKYQELRASVSQGREQDNFAKAKSDLAFQVEEQKNKLLKKEVELQATLQLTAIALGLFLLLTLVSLVVAIKKSQQANLAKLNIQRILDLIEEGILTIGPDLKLQANYSPYLANLYPDLDQQTSQDAISILIPDEFMDNEGKSMVRETLKACLGNDMLTWELNSDHLPTEIAFKGRLVRTLRIHWQPLLDANLIIRGFLLGIRDITNNKNLEDAVVKEQKFVLDLERKLKELLATRYADARTLIDSVTEKIDQWTTEIKNQNVTAATRRDLHTHKGVARTLGLKDLSSSLHDLESSIHDPEAIESLAGQLQQYQRLMQDMLSTRSVSNQERFSLIDIVSAPLQQLRLQLQAVPIDWQGIEICDYVERWPDELLAAVQGSLIHALTNSADHGYILPKKTGWDPGPAAFRIEAHETADEVRLMIRDQGVGLNLQKLAVIAQRLRFTPTGDESIADVIFLEGASTTERITETSGRGVGMTAIRASCLEWGGDAHIQNNADGPGSQLTLSFKKFRKSA